MSFPQEIVYVDFYKQKISSMATSIEKCSSSKIQLYASQENNHLFKENSFLKIIEEHNTLERRLCSTTLVSEGESIEDQIEKFRLELKTPFLQDLMQETDLPLKIVKEYY